MLKKILIVISMSITIFVLVLNANHKNYVKISDISKPRKIALASFMVKRHMLDDKYDKMKFRNVHVYSEYMASSFISNFNITNSYVSLVPLQDVLPKTVFDSIPYTFVINSEYVPTFGYLSTNDVSGDVLKALEGKVDSIMFAQARFSLWSQRVFIDFSVYDLNRELVWRDTFDGTSKYIMADMSITPKTSYNVILRTVEESQKKHEEEIYIVIDDAIKTGIENMVKKFPMIFNTNDYFQTIKTFSLTNNNNITENNSNSE